MPSKNSCISREYTAVDTFQNSSSVVSGGDQEGTVTAERAGSEEAGGVSARPDEALGAPSA